MYKIQNEHIIYIILILIALLLGFIYVFFVVPFMAERHYIKMELERSTGKEYRHWKRELKKLYLCSIPVLGYIFVCYYRKKHKSRKNFKNRK